MTPRLSSHQQDPPPRESNHTPNPQEDEAIVGQLKEHFSRLDFDTSTITCSVLDGFVTLTGSIHDRKAKYHVESLASRIRGVIDVENLLRISANTTPP